MGLGLVVGLQALWAKIPTRPNHTLDYSPADYHGIPDKNLAF